MSKNNDGSFFIPIEYVPISTAISSSSLVNEIEPLRVSAVIGFFEDIL